MRTLRESLLLFVFSALLLPCATAAAQDDFDADFEATPPRAVTTAAPIDDDPFGEPVVDEGPGEAEATSSDADALRTGEGEPVAQADNRAASSDTTAKESSKRARKREKGRVTSDPDLDEARRRAFHRHGTIGGPVGGVHIVDAGTGAPGTFRVGLSFGMFRKDGFIADGDQARASQGVLSLSYTPIKQLEIFANIAAWAASNESIDPTLLQILGDTTLGVKGVWEILPFLNFGGDVRVGFLNRLGSVGLRGSGTSVGLRSNLSFDLRAIEKPKPIVARLNVGYFFDNSINVVKDVEDARWAALEGRPGGVSPIEAQDHLVNAAERFGLQLNRTDFVDLGVGFEFPIEPIERLIISPIAEWNVRIPVNRRDFNCLYLPDGLAIDHPMEACLDREGGKAFPMVVTAGVRVEPKVRGFALLAAVDVGVLGSRTIVKELAPTAPWMVRFGGSYAFDPNREVVREVDVLVEKEVPVEHRALIHGLVVEAGTEHAIDRAIVRFTGRELTPLVAEEGRFKSYLFEPGLVEMSIEHPDYEPGTCSAEIAEREERAPALDAAEEAALAEGEGAETPRTDEPRVVEVRCELIAKPRVGNLTLRIVNESGSGVTGANVEISGPENRAFRTSVEPVVRAEGLQPGTYQVRVEAENFLIKTDELVISANETTEREITLISRPSRALAQLRGKKITIRRQINFATNSAEILESSNALLLEVADVILRNPEIRLLEIQGHTDDRGGAELNLRLSQDRAESVRAWLIRNGVEESRLIAKGYGLTRPLVPNITSANRAKNRRVEFVILESD